MWWRKHAPARYVLLSDTHAPATNLRAFEAALDFIDWSQPERIFHLGDNFDTYWLMSYAKMISSSRREAMVETELEMGAMIWRELAKRSKQPAVVMLGNHEDRWATTMAKYRDLSAYCESPYDRIADEIENLELLDRAEIRVPNPPFPDFWARRGDRSSSVAAGAARGDAVKGFISSIQGHGHGHGFTWLSGEIFAIEAGHLIDLDHEIMAYDPRNAMRTNKAHTGIVWVDVDGVPHTESLERMAA